jgi:hypothetical protein
VKQNKKIHYVILGFVGLIAGGFSYHMKDKWANQYHKDKSKISTDEALLALIKNDLDGFKEYIGRNGIIHDQLPEIDGHKYTVAQGVAYFDRPDFVKYLQESKISFIKQEPHSEYDVLSLAIPRHNPEFFALLKQENPAYQNTYGDKKWTLLHLAAANCSHKLMPYLDVKGKVSWNTKAKDGSTPLTLAAENECLPVLSYWKENGADFKAKDGRGMTALSILGTKENAATVAFRESFITRKIASVTVIQAAAPKEVSFYRKRVIPKDQKIDHSALIEPEDRPLEATETAEHSEFAD